MCKSVLLLSVPHMLQGPNFRGYVDAPPYSDLVASFIKGEKLDFVFEEVGERGPSTAEKLAKSILGMDRYLNLDPPLVEREKHGIPKEIAGGYAISPMHYSDCAEWSDVVGQDARENFWLRSLLNTSFNRGLVIVGLAHTLSFAFCLVSSGIKVETTYTYNPYDRLCTRAHQS
jgi:hypothetical protein